MLLTIHNLPLGVQYGDIKEVLLKCGLRETILDNLQSDVNGKMKVTVGVMEEEDAAILVRKINGIYFRGNQLYVEDKRQAKQESEQPYRSTMQQYSQQYYSDAQQGPPMMYDYNSQVQAMGNAGMYQQYQPMMNYMFAQQVNAQQSVQNAYMAYGNQQLMSQYSGMNEHVQPPYPGTPENSNLFDRRPLLQGMPDADRSGEVVSPRNDRRRPASPSSNRANTQSDLKRTKWDSMNERSDQGFNRHDRYPENSRGHSSNNRGGYFPSQRDDQASSSRDDQSLNRRGGPSSSQRGDQNLNQRGGQRLNQRGGQHLNQRGDQHLNQRGGQSSSERGGLSSSHSGGQSAWQGRGNEDRGSRPYDDRSRSDRKRRWDNSSDRGPSSRQDRRTSPQRGPRTGSSSLGNVNTSQSKSVITKAMFNVMYDMSANLNMEWETSGPSALKTVLCKAIYLRIVDIVGDANMDHEEMSRLYRDRYPRSGDFATYEKIREKLAGNRGCSDAEIEGFLTSLVARDRQRPMRPEFCETKKVPLLSDSQPATLKISIETAQFLNLPDLAGMCPLKTAIRKIIYLRIAAITGNNSMTDMSCDEIWKRYRLKYPLMSDRAMYTCLEQNIAEEPNMTESEKNDYLTTFLDGLPPSYYGRSDFKDFSDENPPIYSQNPSNQNSSFRNQNPSAPNPAITNPKPQTFPQKFKTSHTKAMGLVLYETVRNMGISHAMGTPNPLKTTLRKIITVRLEKVMKKMPMDPVNACKKYRNLYPLKEDADLLQQITQKLSASRNMNTQELKDFATTFIRTTHKSRPLTRDPPKPLLEVAPKLPPNAIGTSKSQLRVFCMQATARILKETAKYLNISVSMEGQSLLETALRKVISTRFKEIIGNVVTVWDVLDTCERYRKLYPVTGDPDMYERIRNAIAEKGETKQVRLDQGLRDFIAGFAVNQNKPIVKKGPPSEPPKPVPPPLIIPNYPQGDKKIFTQQKKQHKAELQTLTGYNLSALEKNVLGQEMKAIRKLLKDTFANPRNGEETLVYKNVNQDYCIESYTKFLQFHLSKRIVDGGTKLCRIYGSPKLPKRNQLQALLSNYGCLSLKKSAKNPFFTATFASYATVDSLCSSGPIDVGDNIMATFKHMHVAPPKPKYSQKHTKNIRKKFVKSLIDNSNVNLLDKDWQSQVEKEKIAKAQKDEADDVILLGDNNVIEPIEISDDDPPEADIFDKSKDTTEAVEDDNTQFLHEDFKVIDEVKESDNDDKEEEPNRDNTICSNQIDDDWDHNGEDWGSVENLANNENVDVENGAVVGENGAVGETGAVVGETGAVVGETGAVVGEAGAVVGETGAVVGETGAVVGETGPVVGEAGAVVGETGPVVGEAGAVVGETGAVVDEIGDAIGETGPVVGETDVNVEEPYDGVGQDDTNNDEDDDDDVQLIAQNGEEIDIANIDWDNVDDDDLEDY